LQILLRLIEKATLAPVIPLFAPPMLFNPDETIFTTEGLLLSVNTLRNSVIDFMAAHNRPALPPLFVSSTNSPLLFAEVLLRNHWHGQNSLPLDFFAREPVMSGLISVSLGIKDALPDPAVPSLGYAKSIIFLTLFGLLDDRATAKKCLKSSVFATGFLLLMLEADFTSIVVESLSSCLSEIDTLPEQVPVFLLSVFEACTQHHTDQHMVQIARDLSQAIVRCLSYNIKLSPALDQVLDPALVFLKLHPTAEIFEIVFTMLMLVTEGQTIRDFSHKRFNLILDIVSTIEGAEPSLAIFRKFQNMLNASTNLSMNLPFLIKVPSVIPIVLIAFSRSRMLAHVLAFFMDLCKHSIGNAIALHTGETTFLLLRAIEGSFEYRGRILEFDFTSNRDQFFQRHVIPLAATILASRLNYEVDQTLRSLITPNAEGVFSPYASLAIEIIDLTFSLTNREPSPQFSNVAPTPLIRFASVDPKRIADGFIFAFYAQMDFMRTLTMHTRFVLLEFVSGPRCFTLYHSQGGISVLYHTPGVRTSTTIVTDFRRKGWDYFLVSMRPSDGVFLMTMEVTEEILDDDSEFPQLIFDGPMDIFIGRTDGMLFSISEESPVTLGPFALFSLPVSESFASQLLHGIDDCLSCPQLILSSQDPNMCVDDSLLRSKNNLKNSFRVHFPIDDCLSIFEHLKNAPAKFAEITIGTLMPCLDLSSLRQNDQIAEVDYRDLLDQVTEISGLVAQHSRIILSPISAILPILLLSDRAFLTYQLYQAFATFFDSVKVHQIASEIFHHILFNVWIWCARDSLTFHRIIKHWPVLLSHAQPFLTNETFVNFLVQSHLLINFSTKDFSDFSIPRFRLLAQLIISNVDRNGLFALLAVLLSVRDKLPELFGYLSVLVPLAQANPGSFDLESVSILTFLVSSTLEHDAFSPTLQVIRLLKGEDVKVHISRLCLLFFSQRAGTATSILDAECIRALFQKPDTFNFTDAEILDDLWFFWPIVVVLVYGETAISAVMDILTRTADDYGVILELLELFEALGVSYAARFRDSLICTMLDLFPIDDVLISSFVALFYRFKTNPHSPFLVAVATALGVDWERYPEVTPPHTALFPFDAKNLRRLFTMDLSHHKLLFEKRLTKVDLTIAFFENATSPLTHGLAPFIGILYTFGDTPHCADRSKDSGNACENTQAFGSDCYDPRFE
jgi:hypothetical protein